MDSNDNDKEIPENQREDQALQLNAKDFVSQAKAKARPQRREHAGSSSRIDFAYRSMAKTKPQRRELAGYSPSIIPMKAGNWITIEPGNLFLSEYEVSKKVIHLLRHSQKVHRDEDGAVHFWRIKGKSSEPIPTIYSLVRRSMESMLGSRRRTQKKKIRTALMIQE